ncbi:hypothetical protein [Nocardia asiatica]
MGVGTRLTYDGDIAEVVEMHTSGAGNDLVLQAFRPRPAQNRSTGPLSRPVRSRARWIEIPIRWHTLVRCCET